MPAYLVLAEQLRATIERGGDGIRLPTEAELSHRHRLSRQTVRRAYQELVADGIVTRVPGRGSFPASAAGPYVRSLSSFEDLLAQSKDTELEIVAPLQRAASPPPEAVRRLGAETLVELRARRLHAGLPYCFVIVSMIEEVGRQLGRVRLLRSTGARRKTTVLELLDGVLRPPIVAATMDVTVDAVPADVAPFLDVDEGRPVLRIDRLYLDANRRPVDLAISYLNPERYSYRLELRRTVAGQALR